MEHPPVPTDAAWSPPSVGLWTGALDMVPVSAARELAAEIEELGFGILWVPEFAGRDIFVHLCQLLAATSRLVGATGVANIWSRDAMAMVAAANALTEAYPNRFLLGLGVSHQRVVEGLRGHQYSSPLGSMRNYLDRMDSATYIAHRPSTPVYRLLAALGPRMLALASERTEGAHSYLVTPEHTAAAREQLGDDAWLCPEQMVIVDADSVSARQTARLHLSAYLELPNYLNNLRRLGWQEEDIKAGGSDRLVDALVAWGSVDAIAVRIAEHFAAGADHVCIQALPIDRRGVPAD